MPLTVLAAGGRYWHTLRHLRPVQWYGRLWTKVWRPPLDLRAPEARLRDAHGTWQWPAGREPSMRSPALFRFLNHEHGLPAAGGWDDPALEQLWRYNLHYFDDLNAVDANRREAWHSSLIERWVAENPPTAGSGWDPYPTSLRIVNWSKWSLTGHDLSGVALRSLALQARWLATRMEFHLLGNHLFSNAKALVFAGLLVDGKEAESWLFKGLRVIESQLPQQVLPDGGNFERSTMYHALFLEDLLDLVNIGNVWPDKISKGAVGLWRDTATRMLTWLEGMLHPDGQIALFNDSAFGIAPDPAQLRGYAQRLGLHAHARTMPSLQIRQWPDSGYVRMESAQAVALLDVAPVGPDYLPGHAHADTLSFELSVFGQRVIVNGGTSLYGRGPERLRERSTAAHSTVEVAGQNSSEVWSGFRVARRAYPFDLVIEEGATSVSVSCSHDGYRRLRGAPVHRRTWAMAADALTITDFVNNTGGAQELPAIARFIFHPQGKVLQVDTRTWRVTLASGEGVGLIVIQGRGSLTNSRYACEFGKSEQTECLTVELQSGRSELRIFWD